MTDVPESPITLAPNIGLEAKRDSGTTVVDDAPLLSLRALTKHFGPVEALRHCDLDIPAGKITALVGDNGAGKSTLIKVIAGIHVAEHGEIRWKGQPVHVRPPHDAPDLGIATVYQDLALCDTLDIVANLFLGAEIRHLGVL